MASPLDLYYLTVVGNRIGLFAGKDLMTRRRISEFLRGDERKAKIEAFIRTKGVTRCPAACVAETQGTLAAADRAALREYVALREEERRERIAESRARIFAALGLMPLSEE
jgi:hypothetical protein